MLLVRIKVEENYMRHFIAKNIGRTFILRMERGDLLREKIAELCQDEKVQDAGVFLISRKREDC